MKKYFFLIAILLFAILIFGCGSGEKPETKENETKQISTAPNSNVAVLPPAVNATNTNPAARKDDLDADDAPLSNSNQAVNGKARRSEKKDADDQRSGSTNRNRLDRDEQRNKTRDADDSGKRDADRDSDDN